jgi:hypothetical protein
LHAATPAAGSQKQNVPITFDSALSWLPADTETIIVANGPFLVPSEAPYDNENSSSETVTQDDLKKQFEWLPIGLLSVQKGILQKHLQGRTIQFALEGSRHFRSPAGLGEMPYEGCEVLVLGKDDPELGNSFASYSRSVAGGLVSVAGHQTDVFKEQMEEDVWTIFVSFPRPNVVMIATSRDYLQTTLQRLDGMTGPRALPDSLSEWKYVHRDAAAWGLRHYDRSQTNLDPSSPFGGEKSGNVPDEGAIGIVFEFDDQSDRSATIAYFSSNADLLGWSKSEVFDPRGDPDAVKELHVQYKLVDKGVVQLRCELNQSKASSYFFFVLCALLGHGVYV